MAVTQKEYNELTSAVGNGLASWTRVETALALLFAYTSDIPHAKAHSIYDAVVAFEARLAVCDRAVALEKMDQLDHETWARLASRIRKFYQKRHEIAHFTLALDKQNEQIAKISPFFTWGKHSTGRTRSLDLAQIRERTSKFDEIESAVMWFVFKAGAARGIHPANPAPSNEVPPLIQYLRELAIRSLEEKSSRPESGED